MRRKRSGARDLEQEIRSKDEAPARERRPSAPGRPGSGELGELSGERRWGLNTNERATRRLCGQRSQSTGAGGGRVGSKNNRRKSNDRETFTVTACTMIRPVGAPAAAARASIRFAPRRRSKRSFDGVAPPVQLLWGLPIKKGHCSTAALQLANIAKLLFQS